MIRLAIVLTALLAISNSTFGLSCSRCEYVDCEVFDNCNYGIARHFCGCCDVCAKGPREECGGNWGIYGTCGEGYTCEESDISIQPGICVEEQQTVKTQLSSGYRSLRTISELDVAAPLLLENRRRDKRTLPFGSRRGGTAKLIATQHSHTAYGGISKKYADLLKSRSKSRQGKRTKRSLLKGFRRAGTAKLIAKKHKHTAFGGIPAKYAQLLKGLKKTNRAGG